MSRGNLTFRLLGPLEVVAGDRTVEIPSYRQRAVLAAMLLDVDGVVPVERLTEAVWEDDPPPTAHKQIQICVSRLRHLFGSLGHGTLIRTRPAGYQFQIDGDAVDYVRFIRLRERARVASYLGDTSAAATALRQALATWRGAALAGLHGLFLQSRATWLDELRWSTYEEYSEMRLRGGRRAELVGELTRALADQPTREKLTGYLMLALYWSGRRADALEAYLAVREVLVARLGVEPGRGLRDLHAAVLADDPDLAERFLEDYAPMPA